MRDETIDIAKGVGIFCVVLGHFAVFASPLYHYIYLFHMPLFFFLSGMFFKKEDKLKPFLLKKTKRLLLPYLFYWVFCHIIMCLNHIIIHGDLDLGHVDFNILNGGVLWFLISLWSVHLIFMIAEKCGIWRYVFWMVVIFAGLLLGYYKLKLPFYLSQTALMFPFFLIGNLCNTKRWIGHETMYQYLKKQKIISIPFLLALVCFIVPCGFLDVNGPIIPNPIQYIITPLSGIIMVLILCNCARKIFKRIGLDKIGKHSLHILGIHSPFVPLMWFVAIPVFMRFGLLLGEQLSGDMIKGMLLVQFVLAVSLTCISYWFGLFIERAFPKLFK